MRESSCRSPGHPGPRPYSENMSPITAVIFDMDGLLFDSEVYWERARQEYAASIGCTWTPEAERLCKGKNSNEWAAVIREQCGSEIPPAGIIAGVSDRMQALYQQHLPVLPGAIEVVRNLAVRYPLGLASSSPRVLIEEALTQANIRSCFSVVVSSDQVAHGKPSPDVFLAAARELGHRPESVAVFEDSSAGIQAAHTAGMTVIAVPNPNFPPSEDALELATIVLPSLRDFREDLLPS